jgi:hypothetical protein
MQNNVQSADQLSGLKMSKNHPYPDCPIIPLLQMKKDYNKNVYDSSLLRVMPAPAAIHEPQVWFLWLRSNPCFNVKMHPIPIS